MGLTAGDIRRRVLYRDADILVIDKPTGLPVHAGTKIQQHLEELLDEVLFDAPEPPRLAHRLDKDTSGCLVLGRHPVASTRLGKLFLAQRVEKVYWAVVMGAPAAEEGRIEAPLLKIAGETGARVEVDPNGKEAVTDWRVLGRGAGLAWLELRPRTGRTHQLRAHCLALGHPILGDPIYGPEKPAPCPLHLHARAIRLPIRHGEPPVTVIAPLPVHMAERFARMGCDEGAAPAAFSEPSCS